MTNTIRVALHAADPIALAGVASQLAEESRFDVVDATQAEADVLLLVADRVGCDLLTTVRRWSSSSAAPIVLVTGDLRESDLLTMIECRVVAVLPRGAATGDRLTGAIVTAATGGGVLPPNLLGSLLKHLAHLQRDVLAPLGLSASGLTPREINVLQMMADGLDTNEIAEELAYSERTVKNVIYDFTSRLKLRNRAHAVAYALRAGII